MRPPFIPSDTIKFEDDTRIKFIYTSPEHNQNIEISVDGDETTVGVLMDAFQRFLGALGLQIPPNVSLELVEYVDKEESDDEDSDEESNEESENDK